MIVSGRSFHSISVPFCIDKGNVGERPGGKACARGMHSLFLNGQDLFRKRVRRRFNFHLVQFHVSVSTVRHSSTLNSHRSGPNSPDLLQAKVFRPVGAPRRLLRQFFESILPVILRKGGRFKACLFNFSIGPHTTVHVLRNVKGRVIRSANRFVSVRFSRRQAHFRSRLGLRVTLTQLRLVIHSGLLRGVTSISYLRRRQYHQLSRFHMFRRVVSGRLRLRHFYMDSVSVSRDVLFAYRLLVLCRSRMSSSKYREDASIIASIHSRLVLQLFGLSFLFRHLSHAFRRHVSAIRGVGVTSNVIYISPVIGIPHNSMVRFIRSVHRLRLLMSPSRAPADRSNHGGNHCPLGGVVMGDRRHVSCRRRSPRKKGFPRGRQEIYSRSIRRRLRPSMRRVSSARHRHPFGGRFARFFFFRLIGRDYDLPTIFFTGIPANLLVHQSCDLRPGQSK